MSEKGFFSYDHYDFFLTKDVVVVREREGIPYERSVAEKIEKMAYKSEPLFPSREGIELHKFVKKLFKKANERGYGDFAEWGPKNIKASLIIQRSCVPPYLFAGIEIASPLMSSPFVMEISSLLGRERDGRIHKAIWDDIVQMVGVIPGGVYGPKSKDIEGHKKNSLDVLQRNAFLGLLGPFEKILFSIEKREILNNLIYEAHSASLITDFFPEDEEPPTDEYPCGSKEFGDSLNSVVAD